MMKKIVSLLALTCAYSVTANAYPVLEQLPKSEAGKAALLIYSSSLRATSSYTYYINNNKAGEIEGDKIRLVYLEPGKYDLKVDVPHASFPLNKSISVQAGKYYFINAYSSTSGKRMVQTSYHLESVDEKAALTYLQDNEKNKSKWYEFTL